MASQTLLLVTMVLLPLHTASIAQSLYDYGAEGLPRAGQRFEASAFIGRPGGGPWTTGEMAEQDGSEGDGIEFSANGREVTLFVSRDGVISGWLDFDSQGETADFSQPADQIIPAQKVRAGYNSFSFSWPQGFTPGTELWARFRFSSSSRCEAVASPAGVSDSCGEVQDYRFDLLPLNLGDLTATPASDRITLQWRTTTESENLGFHLFRAGAAEGPYRQITASLIRGAGTSATPIVYGYSDTTVEPGRIYYYKLADVDYRGCMTLHGPVCATAMAPVDYVLEQVYPNPFNPETRINFRLKEPGRVHLSVFDLKGHEVRQLMAGTLPRGPHTVSWNGRDNHGVFLTSATYIYKLQVDDYEVSRQIQFIR
ncbi:MAG TPA: FlgD immunoglobulin-like domain containing protein [bacterium]|nr:FlgD immunoglobulin-like domain containing protein [bacterium]HPR88330.1 FlgD immunoglobulin-like domain containing protein [bacterium]